MLLNIQRRKRKNVEGASWAVSYVDLLSLLLCFFVIFYDAERTKNISPEKMTALDKLALEINKDAKPATTAAQIENESSEKETYEKVKIHPLIGELEINLKENLPIESIKQKKGLYLSFKEMSFFSSGSSKLNSSAEEVITEMIQRLTPYKGQIHITVQGHTDTRKVSLSKEKHSDNWELSALRATSVLKHFVREGFPQETLSAEGFADTKAQDKNLELSFQRRITLIIEPREDK
jgi:chemotaxis protein MotB